MKNETFLTFAAKVEHIIIISDERSFDEILDLITADFFSCFFSFLFSFSFFPF